MYDRILKCNYYAIFLNVVLSQFARLRPVLQFQVKKMLDKVTEMKILPSVKIIIIKAT